ncbi:MBL fold metallo-hydrolase [candidate division FCPU426 bacterium]|nr:MBL fold metallo-hydrolase [candidate division FCPU426 bacterium]
MRIKYYGARGSLPTPGKSTVKYGGNTTCLSIQADQRQYIVDGGSGLRVLGNDLMLKEFRQGKGETVFFWTHFHWDHIMGFPFFMPNFIAGNKIIHYGSSRVRDILVRQQDFATFPVTFEQMPSTHEFHAIEKQPVIALDGMTVTYCPSNHPAGGYIFKFSHQGRSLIFATDTEHPEAGMDKDLLQLSSGADVLIYDAQYTPEEYGQGRKGWGHSTWEKGVELARAAGVKRLHLFHHDQLHGDAFLEKKVLAPARRMFGHAFLAREGWEFQL